ncbi:unnamed protein product [Cochlearia groenlandica]
MKKSGILTASIYATAVSAVSTNTSVSFSLPDQDSKEKQRKTTKDSEDEKFAPRFDGLRFIETLVTAHR